MTSNLRLNRATTKADGIQRILIAIALLLAILPAAVWIAGAAGTRLRRAYPPPGVLVSVGEYRLHLYCVGSGNPAIILESGLGSDWTSWRLVAPALTRFSRVCMYDRAGYGWSEPGPRPRTAARLSDELHLLLENAHVPQPYVLVAHSFGAYPARVFAARFRRSLAGLTLVDPADEDEPDLEPSLGRRIHNNLPPTGLAGLFRLIRGESAIPPELREAAPEYRNRYMAGGSYDEAAAERAEYHALAESKAQARAAAFPPDLPLTVITATYIVAPGHGGAELDASPGHAALQARLARMSSRGEQIIAPNSGHSVQLDRPQLVIDAIQRMAGNRWR